MPTRKLVLSTIEEDVRRAEGTGDIQNTPASPISAMGYIIATGDLVPPWWSRIRDRELHRLVKQNNHLSGIAYAATTKLKNIPISFIPKDQTISAHVSFAEQFTETVRLVSEFGRGLRKTMERFLYDYFIFDNGGFMEVLGDGNPEGPIIGTPHGVRHLDSLQCTRTGHPIYPVVYETVKNRKKYKLHYTRVIAMSQQESGIASMNGVGFSAASRSFEVGQVLADQLEYKLEKMGSRPASKLIVTRGIDTNEVLKAFMMAEELMDNLGLRRYGKTVILGGDENAGATQLDLNNFEPFNEEVGTLMAIYALAYTWGLDVRDIWPIAGAKSSDEVANMKARGRLPADFTADLKDQFDLKLCPPFIETKFDFQDDEEDQLQAVNRDIRARMVMRLADSGVIDGEAQRRIMYQAGDMTRQEFVRQQLASGKLEDGSPIASVFWTEDKIMRPFLVLEGIEDPLVYEDNDKEEVVRQIHVNRSAALRLMASTTSEPQKQRMLLVISALDWLETEYENIPEEVPDELLAYQEEMPAEEEGEDSEEEYSEEGDSQEGGQQEDTQDNNQNEDEEVEQERKSISV